MEEIFNAVIQKTFLGKEDHGIPTCVIHVKHDAFHQDFGGYDLRFKNQFLNLFKILDVVGVDRYEDLAGKFCRIKIKDRMIVEIGNIVDNKWCGWNDPVEE